MLSLLSLLVSLPSAQAQTSHCWQVTYTNNGTFSCTIPNATPPNQSGNWTAGSNGDSLSGSNTQNGNLQGTVTATLTWVPAVGQTMQTDPPPSPVTIIEQGDAYENSLLGTDSNTHGPAGSASDGLGDAPVVTGNGYTSSGYHALSPQDGSSGTIALSGVTLSAQNPTYSVTNGYPPYTRWPGGQTAVGLSIILPPPLQGHSTMDSANWDAMLPRFFSGTNCSVSGTATAYSAPPGNAAYPNGGSYVTKATLSIGGALVKEYDDTNSPPSSPNPNVIYLSGTNQSSVPLSVFFDSTHFADTTSISAQMTVTDSGGLTYTVNLSANAYNKIYILGNSQMPNNHGSRSEGDILQIFASGNIYANPTTTDLKPAIESNIPTYTDFYAYTHADPGIFGDCTAVPAVSPNPPDPAHYLVSSEVSSAMAKKTSSQPAYNFVFFCACQAAGDATLANAFGISGSSTDRAFLGFTTDVDNTDTTQAWAKAVCSNLQGGSTLLTAVRNANQNGNEPKLGGSDAGWKIIGDQNMTLNGTVYGGATGALAR